MLLYLGLYIVSNFLDITPIHHRLCYKYELLVSETCNRRPNEIYKDKMNE